MITVPAEAPAWAHRFASDLDAEFRRMAIRRAPVRLASHLKADLPAAGQYPQCWIYVSDDVGGETPAFSDGTNWRRCADLAVIS